MKRTKRRRRRAVPAMAIAISVVFVSIAAVALLQQYRAFEGVTGNIIAAPSDGAVFPDTKYCNDTDGGVFFGAKGSVLYKPLHKDEARYNDTCDGLGRNLIEYYCRGNSYGITTKLCRNGCVDTRCIEDTDADRCYLGFDINESRLNDSTRFSIASMTGFYGSYDHMVNHCSPGNAMSYIITAKNRTGEALGRYAAESSRFVFWDDFSGAEPRGGIEELNESAFSVIMPFDADMYSLAINDTASGRTTALRLPRAPSCSRTCRLANEGGLWGAAECCAGLQAVQTAGNYRAFVCVNCGDGICSPNEDRYSCAEDCG